jgi:pimeloyl-ACP methyl ester carboxylesterase
MRKFLTTNLEHDADGHWRWTVNLPVLMQALPELLKNPLDAADRFVGPASFILSGRSGFVQPGDHALIRRHFPSARITVLPESGHAPHLEAREEFVRLVLEEA